MELLERLIIHTIREVRDASGSLAKTKLMKLLYLMDVEAYRSFQRTITGARWFFFLYGPYATEIDNAIDALAGYHVQESHFLSSLGRRGFSYTTDEDPHFDEALPLDKRLIVQDVINRWANEELNTVLDYVYFETSPMAKARFGETLDFSAIERETIDADSQFRMEPIPRDLLDRLRAQYKATHARQTPQREAITPPRYDDIYRTSLEIMNAEDRADLKEIIRKDVQVAESAKDSLRDQS